MKDVNAAPPPEPEEFDLEELDSSRAPVSSQIVLEGDDKDTCPRGVWPATIVDQSIEPDAFNEHQRLVFLHVLADTPEGPQALWVRYILPDNNRCTKLLAMFKWLKIGASSLVGGTRRIEAGLEQLLGAKVSIKVEDRTFVRGDDEEPQPYVYLALLRPEAAKAAQAALAMSRNGQTPDGR
jgi:hypothetical protein